MSAKILPLRRNTAASFRCVLCESIAPAHSFRGRPVCQSCADSFRLLAVAAACADGSPGELGKNPVSR
ncbi:MAG: hypothetical protein LBH21_02335 [Gracilibacteraceae bacterium]|jgi:hypothetical protein|nr:hypothetical protein [Gracilibacteraceae bacterium]